MGHGTEDQGASNVGETGERNDSDMRYVNGKGRGLTAEVETAEGSDTAGGNDTAADVEGRQRHGWKEGGEEERKRRWRASRKESGYGGGWRKERGTTPKDQGASQAEDEHERSVARRPP